MAQIGIVGGGVAGLQLGLFLQRHGIESTIYAEQTPEQLRAQRLTNLVCRNGITRARERLLGVNHWDAAAPDLVRLSVCVRRGTPPIAFSGELEPAAHCVDMRVYWATLLEDYSQRGGRVVFTTVGEAQVDALAAAHDLMVVASGRGRLARMFSPVPGHSPFGKPQRLVIGGFFRGIAYPTAPALEVTLNPGQGEILSFPAWSSEPDLTGLAVEIVPGGAFERLAEIHVTDDPRPFDAALLGLVREYAPELFARIDSARFGLTRPLDLAHVAITPVVRRGYVRLSNDRFAVALGDAHVLLDPLTGQGANNASHSAWVLAEAIRDSHGFDELFCNEVERRICAYAVPVSDACNARLAPPEPHFLELVKGAGRHQELANIYSDGFNHPDRFWATASSSERTAALLAQFHDKGVAAL
jgi:2-polyprenyl-6-methoxyphenol hydroxylase-like FAD-dependent oxidoreductase